MSATTEAFKAHRIWDLLIQWGRALDQALDANGVTAENVDVIARMRAVLTLLGKRLENADPYLFTPNWVESLAAVTERAIEPVRSFVGGDTAALQTAQAATFELLGVMATMPSAATTSEFQGSKKAAEDYRKALDTMMRRAAAVSEAALKEVETTRARLAELATEVTAERSRVTTVASEFQSQFSAAQETRSQNEVTAQKDRETRLAALLADFTQKLADRDQSFAVLQEDTRKAADGLVTQVRTEFSGLRDTQNQAYTEQLTELRAAFVTKAAELQGEMTTRKDEILKLVGVIGNAGVTSSFLDTANNARKEMAWWQRVTVGSIVALIAVALFLFLPQTDRNAEFSWAGFAARVYVSLTFMALAGYAASEARNNQKADAHNRRIAMELQAVGPFIVNLPAQQQEEFIKQLADRTFRGSVSSEVEQQPLPPGTLQALETFGKTLTEAIKAARK